MSIHGEFGVVESTPHITGAAQRRGRLRPPGLRLRAYLFPAFGSGNAYFHGCYPRSIRFRVGPDCGRLTHQVNEAIARRTTIPRSYQTGASVSGSGARSRGAHDRSRRLLGTQEP